MRLRHVLQPLIFLLCSVILASAARADLSLVFSRDNGNTFSNSFSSTVGNSLTIGIFLQQTAPDTILTNEGLIGFGLDLSQLSGAGTISNPSQNTFFDFSNHNSVTGNGFEWEFFETANTGLKGSTLMIGSFQFNSDSVGDNAFSIEDRLVGAGLQHASWLTPTLNPIDESIFGAGATETYDFNIDFSAIPEPGICWVLASTVLLAKRRRNLRPSNA